MAMINTANRNKQITCFKKTDLNVRHISTDVGICHNAPTVLSTKALTNMSLKSLTVSLYHHLKFSTSHTCVSYTHNALLCYKQEMPYNTVNFALIEEHETQAHTQLFQ